MMEQGMMGTGIAEMEIAGVRIDVSKRWLEKNGENN
tara:strand:+ start:4190 stop:4297 length:108 start_codon:yes stop_codon:yes gene_type:complete